MIRVLLNDKIYRYTVFSEQIKYSHSYLYYTENKI